MYNHDTMRRYEQVLSLSCVGNCYHLVLARLASCLLVGHIMYDCRMAQDTSSCSQLKKRQNGKSVIFKPLPIFIKCNVLQGG